MFTSRRSRILIASSAVLAATAALAPAATRTDAVNVPADKSRTATAKCPGDQRVGFAGFRTILNNTIGTVLTGLSPAGRHNSTARGYELANNAGKTTAIAFCGGFPRLRRVTKSKALPDPVGPPKRGGPPGKKVTATAKCPKGSTLQSGGWAVTKGGALNVIAARRIGSRRWKVTAAAFDVPDSAAGAKLNVIAACAKAPAPTVVIRKISLASTTNKVVKATPKCPKHTHAVMGGVGPYPSGDDYFREMRRVSRRRVRIALWHFAATMKRGAAIKINAYAYCA